MNVTVGMSSYNQSGYLIEAIDSALAQTWPPAEILIVDDASTDGSQEIVKGYAARFPDLIRPILLERNTGVNAVRNRILDEAAGSHLAYLDGDDLWRPTKLEKEVRRLAEPDADAVFTNIEFTAADGTPLRLWADATKPPQGYILPQVIARDFPRRNLFRYELVPLSVWREAGYHDEAMPLYTEWEMRIRLAQRLRWAYIDEPLQTYRLHGTGMASTPADVHLDSLDYLERKHQALIDNLPTPERRAARKGLATWRALLLRRKARETAQQHQPGSRAHGFRLYFGSLRLHPYLDVRLLKDLLT